MYSPIVSYKLSGVPTYVGTSDVRRQSTSKNLGVGTPNLGQDIRLSGVSTQGLPMTTVTAQAK